LPNHVLEFATHYGLFRSADGGQSWQKVAAGPNQPMAGLMTYSLNKSPLDSHRLYVLSQPISHAPAGTPGLYTSTDEGRTWKMSITTSSLSNIPFYLEAPGNQQATQVYIYLNDKGAKGLMMSMDAGKHFTQTGQLPFGSILGVLPLPGKPGQVLIYGDTGIAHSTDGGKTWKVISDTTNGSTYEMTTSGPNQPIYATGDIGISRSLDGGKSFQSTGTQTSYVALTPSPTKPGILYGKTGRQVARSSDGGKTWTPLPAIKGNLGNLSVDVDNPDQVYLSLSYPAAVYTFVANSASWHSLTPKS
jgi:photosystem II stability/assembly factor-like uncharacterized protein